MCDERCMIPENACDWNCRACDDQPVQCSSECYTHDGTDYRGKQNTTAEGSPCVRWDLMGMSGPGLSGHAECRNPDGKRAPWCFTHARKRTWGYCRIETASSDAPCDTRDRKPNPPAHCAPRCTPELLSNNRCDDECNAASCNYDMNACSDTECFEDTRALGYRGTMYKTVSGITCQNWHTSYPHFHSYDGAEHTSHGIGNHNFCRNPDNYSTAWCFTTSFDMRWESCDQVNAFWRPNCSEVVAPRCPRRCANGLGDGVCDPDCDRSECLWDGGDCSDALLELGARLGVNVSRAHTYSQNARRFAHSHPLELWSVLLAGMCVGAATLRYLTRYIRAVERERVRRGLVDPDCVELRAGDA